jgi:uncharacterized protein YegL
MYLVDCSGSMAGKKIEALNSIIRETIKPMRDVADENPNAEVLVRVVTFSDGAQWHVSQPTEIHQFKWTDLDAGGVTDMGKALSMVAEAMKMENMPSRGLPPVLVMISDGQPTDDFSRGLKALMDEPWGKRAVRVAVAIGENADLEVLQKFIGNAEVQPLVANNVQELAKMVKWASTVPLKAASNPATRVGAAGQGQAAFAVPMPPPPGAVAPASPADVF